MRSLFITTFMLCSLLTNLISQDPLIKYDIIITGYDNQVSLAGDDIISILTLQDIQKGQRFGITNALVSTNSDGMEIWNADVASQYFYFRYMDTNPIPAGAGLLLGFSSSGIVVMHNGVDITNGFDITSSNTSVSPSQFLDNNNLSIHMYQGFFTQERPDENQLTGMVLDGIVSGTDGLQLSSQLEDKTYSLTSIGGPSFGDVDITDCDPCEILLAILDPAFWNPGDQGTSGIDLTNIPDLTDCLCPSGPDVVGLLYVATANYIFPRTLPCNTVNSYSWYEYDPTLQDYVLKQQGTQRVSGYYPENCGVTVKLEFECEDGCDYEEEIEIPCDCDPKVTTIDVTDCVLTIETELCENGNAYLIDENGIRHDLTGNTFTFTDNGDYDLYLENCENCTDTYAYHTPITVTGCGPCEASITAEFEPNHCRIYAEVEGCPQGVITFDDNNGTVVSMNVSSGGPFFVDVDDIALWTILLENCPNCDRGDLIVEVDVIRQCEVRCTAQITGDSEVCNGAQTVLTADIVPNTAVSWEWNTNPVLMTPDITVSAGTYMVTVTDDIGCSDTAEFTVSDIPMPTPRLDLNGCDVIYGSNHNVDPSCTEELWYRILGQSNWQVHSSLPVVTSVVDAEWKLVVTCPACGTVESNIVTTNCNPCVGYTATISPNQNPVEICDGETVTLTAVPQGGVPNYTYQWNNGALTQATTVSSAGFYVVSVTDGNGCLTITSKQVIEYPSPSYTIVANPNSACAGTNITYSTDPTGSTYLWTVGGQTYNTPTISHPGGVLVEVTVTDQNGCTGTADITVPVNDCQPIITDNGCSLTVDVSGCNGWTSITWTDDTGSTIATDVTDICVQNGTYTVSVVDQNGCIGTATINHSGCSCNLSVGISGDTDLCYGETTNLITNVAGAKCGIDTYAWSNGSNSANLFNVSTSGTYVVTVTDGIGCTSTASFSVFVNPQLDVNISGPTEMCSGQSIQLTASAFGGTPSYSYNWTPGGTGSALTVLGGGSFTVVAQDANQCTASETHNVTEIVLPNSTTKNHCTVPQTLSSGMCNSYNSCIQLDLNNYFNIPYPQNGTWSIVTPGLYGLTGYVFSLNNTPALYEFEYDAGPCSESYFIDLQEGPKYERVSICENSGTIDLLDINSPIRFGNWLVNSNPFIVSKVANNNPNCPSGDTHSVNTNLDAFNTNSLSPGVYIYEVEHPFHPVETCQTSKSYIEVEVTQVKSAGSPSLYTMICSNDQNTDPTSFNLDFVVYGEDTGGTWHNGVISDPNTCTITDNAPTAPITNGRANLTLNGCAEYDFTYKQDNPGCTPDCTTGYRYYAEVPTGLQLTPTQSAPYCLNDPIFYLDLTFNNPCGLQFGQSSANANNGFYLEASWNLSPGASQINNTRVSINPNVSGNQMISATIIVRHINAAVGSFCDEMVSFNYDVTNCCSNVNITFSTPYGYPIVDYHCENTLQVNASGGASPYSNWSITNISPPTSGVVINSNSGLISGLNNVSTNIYIDISVDDNDGCIGTGQINYEPCTGICNGSSCECPCEILSESMSGTTISATLSGNDCRWGILKSYTNTQNGSYSLIGSYHNYSGTININEDICMYPGHHSGSSWYQLVVICVDGTLPPSGNNLGTQYNVVCP